MAKKRCYNNLSMKLIYFYKREDEDKRRQENGQTRIFFLPKLSVLSIYPPQKNQSIHF